jgi:hypothetical protein
VGWSPSDDGHRDDHEENAMHFTTAPIATLAAVPFLLLGLAGCSQGSEAGETDAPKSQSEIEKQATDWELAFSACLKGSGVAAGESKDGEKTAITPKDGVDVEAVLKKCEQQVTDERGERPVSDANKQEMQEGVDQQRKVAACVREKGYDMPDPEVSEDGGSVSSQMVDVPDDVMKACQMQSGGGK